MHGRLKVRTTEQEQAIKRKEREQKVKAYKAAMGRIMKIRGNVELNDEMLILTREVLQRNPDIYTLWNIRREIFLSFKKEKSDEEMGKLVDNEVKLTENCLMNNQKSYCAWHHRGWVLDLHPEPKWTRELALCTEFLKQDERNFHCWDYLRLAAAKSGFSPLKQFELSDEKIKDNFSNYSAWHYRSKLLPLTHPDPEGNALIEPRQHSYELGQVESAAYTDPNDSSAWFYQRWLLGRDCSVAQRQPPKPLLCWLGPHKAIVSFSKHSRLAPQLFVDGQTVEGEWMMESKYVWVLKHKIGNVDLIKKAEVVTEGGRLELQPSSIGLVAVVAEDSQEHNQVVMDTLKGQLKNCKLLLTLTPDCRWTYLTAVFLMQAIDVRLFHGETMEFLDKLIQLDPLRAGHYDDLRSKYVMEFKLSLMEGSFGVQESVSLSQCHLSSLYHFNQLALVREMCRKLDLSHNCLVTLDSMPGLPALEWLDLSDNELTKEPGRVDKNLRNANLTALKSLSVQDNPCSDLLDIEDLLQTLSFK
ncbi:Hypothetical predicted protein [Cloeon dipterum]|uniref:Geranylgeranyl transferase type-2 subunit alpha n=1 Tax=Cloeon dipterum TaxID=197152 RepID=A0A8S1DPR5_9INSE|nr:Hypothetical predicted protein [Cloeon dipterum]